MKDELGKRMKENYEQRTRTFLPRRTYAIIRLDGKAFHTFTRGMKRPFDQDFIDMMTQTALFLCEKIQGCKMGYVQSDEISLLLTDFDTITTDVWFDGNIQKIVSVGASMATSEFNKNWIRSFLIQGIKGMENYDKIPLANFDARVFTIPDPTEVENYFIWRQKDAIRNSIAMTAQSLYPHKELNGKSQSAQQEMIFQKGQNWNDMPDGFKRGRTIYQKKTNTMSADSFDQSVYIYKEWCIEYLDFIKDRKILTDLIPRY